MALSKMSSYRAAYYVFHKMDCISWIKHLDIHVLVHLEGLGELQHADVVGYGERVVVGMHGQLDELDPLGDHSIITFALSLAHLGMNEDTSTRGVPE